jgi:hypothetical protein
MNMPFIDFEDLTGGNKQQARRLRVEDMKLILQIVVCSVFSVGFKNLLYAYWVQKEGENPNHLSDAWVFGVIGGVIIGLLVIEGWIAVHDG